MKSFKFAGINPRVQKRGKILRTLFVSCSKVHLKKTADKLGSWEVIMAVRKACHPEKIQGERRHSTDHAV